MRPIRFTCLPCPTLLDFPHTGELDQATRVLHAPYPRAIWTWTNLELKSHMCVQNAEYRVYRINSRQRGIDTKETNQPVLRLD